MPVSKFFSKLYTLLVVLVFAGLMGCQNPYATPNTPASGMVDPISNSATNDLQRTTEAELVEEMARYRNAYEQQLQLLGDFYDKQGNYMKSGWVKQELEAIKMLPRHAYLVVAEIAGSELKAARAIVEADALYEEGLAMYDKARGIFNRMMDKKSMYQARDKFNELITTYPESDKIDDAAYQIAQINNLYLKDFRAALIYYQRVWQWDPQTPWPARYEVARIYDHQYHDKVKAIEYYEKAISMEQSYPANAAIAISRVKALSNPD